MWIVTCLDTVVVKDANYRSSIHFASVGIDHFCEVIPRKPSQPR